MAERKKKLDRQHELPISRQCSALDISRSSAYRKPAGVNDDDVGLMHKLDALHLRHPFKGSRRLRMISGMSMVFELIASVCSA